jgi:uncharacterized protein (TIGR01777 family)
MRVAVSASTGLVGRALCTALVRRGDEVMRMVRGGRQPGPDEIPWDPAHEELDPEALSGLDAVVHLSGEPIASGRWNAIKKQRILHSREQSTRFLCEQLAKLDQPPRTLICASAVGYYGNRGDEELNEQSPAGTGFLADVCQRWEAACAPARDAGIRVVNLRISMVLDASAGALPNMLTPFRLGLGGRLGDGRAYISWITLEDLVRAALFCIDTPAVNGPVNAASPHPVRNADFTKALARALQRPAIFPVPAAVLKAALGEMAQEILLSSTRAVPAGLQAAGFSFTTPDIDVAFRKLLGA